MSPRHKGHWLSLALALASVAEPVAADVAPIDSCTTEGASCANARPTGMQSGTCQSTRCQRYNPVYDTDGGVTLVPVEYDCLRCLAGGSAGSAGSATAGSSGMESGCDCDVPGRSSEGSVAALMLVVGALALAVSRRRG